VQSTLPGAAIGANQLAEEVKVFQGLLRSLLHQDNERLPNGIKTILQPPQFCLIQNLASFSLNFETIVLGMTAQS
jgi:hypothetical protein